MPKDLDCHHGRYLREGLSLVQLSVPLPLRFHRQRPTRPHHGRKAPTPPTAFTAWRTRAATARPFSTIAFTTKIIPGYGREHLTPQVVDWDGDGKPDVIAGERLGYINLWKNTSTDNDPAHLQFDTQNPQHIKFGGIEKFGLLSTVTVCDLTGNKLPNLILSDADPASFLRPQQRHAGRPAIRRSRADPGRESLPQDLRRPDELEDPQGILDALSAVVFDQAPGRPLLHAAG